MKRIEQFILNYQTYFYVSIDEEIIEAILFKALSNPLFGVSKTGA